MKKFLMISILIFMCLFMASCSEKAPEETQDPIVTGIVYISSDEGKYHSVVTLNDIVKPIDFKSGYYAAITAYEIDGKPVLLEIKESMTNEWLTYLTGETKRIPSYKIYSIIGSPKFDTTDFEQLSLYIESCQPDAEENVMEALQIELKEAQKNGDYEKVAEILDKIVEIQNQNGYSVEIETRGN